MNTWNFWWWVLLPYLAMGTFVVGHIWRWQYDQFGWTSRSTELQERVLLKWGSPLFHYGTFAAIAGHFIGILIPKQGFDAIGMTEDPYYRYFAAIGGTIAAVMLITSIAMLAYRRTMIPRVRATTSPVDWVVLILLLIVIVLGVIPTIGINLIGDGYDYRTSVALWFRGLFAGNPDVSGILSAPLIYQIHVTAAWAVLAIWPFTRLVHAWSFPMWYLWRPFIVYRSREATSPTEPGTSGRRWRRIGAPY